MPSKINKHLRRGSATVELAICLPVIFLITLGAIELNASIHLKQTLTSAAHEGALLGTGLQATEEEIIDRVNLVLNARKITSPTIAIETSDGTSIEMLESGEIFTIVVSADPTDLINELTSTRVEARVSAMKP